MPLSPSCAEKYQVTQPEIFAFHAMTGLTLKFCRTGNLFIEYVTEGNLDKAGAVNPSPAGSPQPVGGPFPVLKMPGKLLLYLTVAGCAWE